MLTAEVIRKNRLKREWNISNRKIIEEEHKEKRDREFAAKVAGRLLGNHGPKIQSVVTFIDDMYEFFNDGGNIQGLRRTHK